mmetsp:Transcript_26361/g.66290  ORF Transcript_26361/g.66290 Transcript_26361/m.66290 type:complete len:154 (-) Transcript_26361:30-491(-)|eukprot:CAMPEP_0174233808 /NCGR_PEP_ID=MMETSP0417-20130205/3748_1 /TAXON_ID=242541 /ORGANISM="Mayorella sp, Strain BSH-02190019" /LENGTH=153 /DNA_ID=CAMNT_0015312083 /DNA_START=15 /DNA_END=476 /DNA_ORIENTATION=-
MSSLSQEEVEKFLAFAQDFARSIDLSLVDAPPSFKLVLVARADLGMSTGKVAAQCVHAALDIHRQLLACREVALVEMLQRWEHEGEKTVLLRGENAAQLQALKLKAASSSKPLLVATVHDAGRTEVESGSLTVLAVAGEESAVDVVTGTLPLY